MANSTDSAPSSFICFVSLDKSWVTDTGVNLAFKRDSVTLKIYLDALQRALYWRFSYGEYLNMWLVAIDQPPPCGGRRKGQQTGKPPATKSPGAYTKEAWRNILNVMPVSKLFNMKRNVNGPIRPFQCSRWNRTAHISLFLRLVAFLWDGLFDSGFFIPLNQEVSQLVDQRCEKYKALSIM